MESVSPSYKWVILIAGCFFHFTFTAAFIFLPTIEAGFAGDLGLDSIQISWIYSIPMLAFVIFVILGGIITDKIGLRNATIISGIVITCFGMLLGISGGFLSLLITSFLFGVGGGLLYPNLAKIVADWFEDEKKGTASGIYLMAGGSGQVVALAITVPIILPLFHSNWRFCFIFYGLLSLISAVLWIFIVKEKQSTKESSHISISKETFKRILTNKYILGLCVIIFFAFSILIGYTNYMEEFIIEKGFSIGIFGYLASLLSLGVALGNVSLPTLSDKVGRRKIFLIICAAVAIFLMISLHFVTSELMVWILIFILGLMTGTLIPLCLTICIEIKTLPKELAGTISGIVLSFGFLGGFSVSLIFGALLTSGIFWFCVIYLICFGVSSCILGFLQEK